MSGVDFDGRRLRKGAADAIVAHVKALDGRVPAASSGVETVAREGGTAARRSPTGRRDGRPSLKDIVKTPHQGPASPMLRQHGDQDR
jgi:K+-transporting ATPase ATPase B chain